MKIDVVTIHPAMFRGPMSTSMMKKARDDAHLDFQVHDLKQWGLGKRKQVDDVPYGGGAGMVIRPEPVFKAFQELASPEMYRIYLTPQGKRFDQAAAHRLAEEKHLILLAGHYEGVDDRVRQKLIDEEISIGDYVLTGGELPAMVLIDAVTRLIPGVLGDERSDKEETFSDLLDGGLEYPHYTRPETYVDPQTGKELKVPKVLLSGHHKDIETWRKEQSAALTKDRRPDLG